MDTDEGEDPGASVCEWADVAAYIDGHMSQPVWRRLKGPFFLIKILGK